MTEALWPKHVISSRGVSRRGRPPGWWGIGWETPVRWSRVNHAVVFRGVVAGVLVTFVIVGTYIGLRIWKGRAKVVTGREGRLKFDPAVLLELAWMSASVAFVVKPAWMSWSALPLPPSLRWAGVGVILATFSLAISAFFSLGKIYSGTVVYSGSVVIKYSHMLVTSGPYRWVRHPIFTSHFALALSIFLLTTNWFIGLALLTLSILLALRVEEEEALLLERFGDEYRAYMQRTGRFLPQLLRHQ